MPARRSRATAGSRRSQSDDQFWVRARERMDSAAHAGGTYGPTHTLLELGKLTLETDQLAEWPTFGGSKIKLFAK